MKNKTKHNNQNHRRILAIVDLISIKNQVEARTSVHIENVGGSNIYKKIQSIDVYSSGQNP